jgi:threonine dehydrogenase-like Zn-dependent dehydrogenase
VKAAVKAGKEHFRIEDVEMPAIGPGDCLVRIHYCAICVWCYHEWLRDGTDDVYGPGITGHEMSGVVVAVGGDVKGFTKGDRVLTYYSSHCGRCPECLAGKEPQCVDNRRGHVIHGYAEYVAVAENCLLPVPDKIDLKEAGLLGDMLGTAMHAIRRAFSVGLPHEVVAVWGLGPIGLFVVQGLKTWGGVAKVLAIDPVESRRKLARSLGADEALDPLEAGVEGRLKRENGGRGVDYAFNCAIRTLSAEHPAFSTLRTDGYLMNLTGQALSGHQTEKRVDGSFYFNRNEYADNVKLVLDGRIALQPILTHVFPLEEIDAAMDLRAKHPDQSVKVTVRCLAEEPDERHGGCP